MYPRILCKYSRFSCFPNTEPFMNNNKCIEKHLNILSEIKQHFISDPLVLVSFGSRCDNETPLTVFKPSYDFQDDSDDNSIPHKHRSRLHSEAQFCINCFRFPLYKQHCVDATIIFWVIRHLGVFT